MIINQPVTRTNNTTGQLKVCFHLKTIKMETGDLDVVRDTLLFKLHM